MLPKSPILLNGIYTINFERVELFKHLGIVISSDLSWSNHITSIGAKAKRILGLLYRRYYKHVEGHVSSNNFISHLSRSKKLRWFQSPAAWDAGYEDLLELVGLPPLEQRRIYLELCLLFEITHGLYQFPTGIFTLRQIPHNFRMNSLQLYQPFALINAFHFSFVPYTISLWNSLHPKQVAGSYSQFKHHIRP